MGTTIIATVEVLSCSSWCGPGVGRVKSSFYKYNLNSDGSNSHRPSKGKQGSIRLEEGARGKENVHV